MFDIDETLVYAALTPSEFHNAESIDTKIKIKVTRFGGQQKAYLSFRPYLLEMLHELREDFELILYTCGTKSYASAFVEAVHQKYKDMFPLTGKDFSLFDHVLSL